MQSIIRFVKVLYNILMQQKKKRLPDNISNRIDWWKCNYYIPGWYT